MNCLLLLLDRIDCFDIICSGLRVAEHSMAVVDFDIGCYSFDSVRLLENVAVFPALLL